MHQLSNFAQYLVNQGIPVSFAIEYDRQPTDKKINTLRFLLSLPERGMPISPPAALAIAFELANLGYQPE
ncbi:MAG: hypothetical protein QNJ72_45625 [Pleurocapsa sp. MO_226.B13]|nr:hypothetical protein [Pleurocapsa sp. MO_226.B13]